MVCDKSASLNLRTNVLVWTQNQKTTLFTQIYHNNQTQKQTTITNIPEVDLKINHKQDPLLILPFEIILNITSYLSINDLISLSLVSINWNTIFTSSAIWLQQYQSLSIDIKNKYPISTILKKNQSLGTSFDDFLTRNQKNEKKDLKLIKSKSIYQYYFEFLIKLKNNWLVNNVTNHWDYNFAMPNSFLYSQQLQGLTNLNRDNDVNSTTNSHSISPLSSFLQTPVTFIYNYHKQFGPRAFHVSSRIIITLFKNEIYIFNSVTGKLQQILKTPFENSDILSVFNDELFAIAYDYNDEFDHFKSGIMVVEFSKKFQNYQFKHILISNDNLNNKRIKSISINQKFIISNSYDYSINIWNLKTGNLLYKWKLSYPNIDINITTKLKPKLIESIQFINSSNYILIEIKKDLCHNNYEIRNIKNGLLIKKFENQSSGLKLINKYSNNNTKIKNDLESLFIYESIKTNMFEIWNLTKLSKISQYSITTTTTNNNNKHKYNSNNHNKNTNTSSNRRRIKSHNNNHNSKSLNNFEILSIQDDKILLYNNNLNILQIRDIKFKILHILKDISFINKNEIKLFYELDILIIRPYVIESSIWKISTGEKIRIIKTDNLRNGNDLNKEYNYSNFEMTQKEKEEKDFDAVWQLGSSENGISIIGRKGMEFRLITTSFIP